jgi:threonine/homoserine/homoserine lactone efflux protein
VQDRSKQASSEWAALFIIGIGMTTLGTAFLSAASTGVRWISYLLMFSGLLLLLYTALLAMRGTAPRAADAAERRQP